MTTLIADLEQLIRSNQVQEAHKRINALSFADVPRVHVAKLANLALRAGALFWAIKLLNPFVRNDSSGIAASDEERIEYAFALIRIGAHSEAKRILEPLNQKPYPRVHMYLAAIHSNAWDYESSLNCFKKYLSFPHLTDYEKLVGRLNLAGAMVGGDVFYDEAKKILAELRSELAEHANKLLYGNTLELSAQLCVKTGDYNQAEKWIALGLDIFKDVDSPYALFFKKWNAILKLRRGDSDAQSSLDEVRVNAVRIQHHESIREIDSYRAIDSADEGLFNRVYFGTPWEKYREKILKAKPARVTLHSTYDHFGNSNHETSAPIVKLDKLGAHIMGSNATLKSGQLLHRVLVGLLSDLYRPVWVAALHTHLFPDEFFHPEAGPKRVHQAIFRLRNWFSENNIPLEICETNGRYYLNWTAPCCIRLELEKRTLQGPEAICEKLVQHFHGDEFATQEAARVLNLSPTSARDALRWGVEHKILEKIGNGPSTRYKKVS